MIPTCYYFLKLLMFVKNLFVQFFSIKKQRNACNGILFKGRLLKRFLKTLSFVIIFC